MSGELPRGWVETTVGELGDWRGGGTPSKANAAYWTNGNIPWVSPKDMKCHFLDDAEDHITEAAVEGSATQLIPKQSVLIVTRSGILKHTLPVAVNSRDVAINQDLKALTPHPGISAGFLAGEFRADAKEILSDCSKAGTTVDSVDFDKLKARAFRLAPTAEQYRIVTKVDSLFGRSSRARDELAHIPKLIERYRQALLGAAFRGDLTADFREKSRPAQWAEVSAKDLFKWSSGKNLPKSTMKDGNYPVYGGNGVNGCHSEANSLAPTIIIGRVGALCGNVYASMEPCWVTDNAIYATSISGEIRLRFAQLAFTFARLRERAGGSSQPFVNQQILNCVTIPLPSVEEQDQIVRAFEAAMSAVGSISADWTAALALINRLDRSILCKAFNGQLVPQDPADEPASKLLERIQAAKATEPKAKQGRKPKGV